VLIAKKLIIDFIIIYGLNMIDFILQIVK